MGRQLASNLFVCLALVTLIMGSFLVSGPTARAQTLPPRPTLTPEPPPASTPEPERDRDRGGTALGRITGTVIDLSTGAPTAGLTVTVGERSVTSDANGNYDVTDLAPGAYAVTLIVPPERGESAQGTLTVELAAGATVVQHLAFRSPVAAPVPAPEPTPLPAPEPPPAPPVTLPNTAGGPDLSGALGLAGLLLAAVGVALRRRGGAKGL